MKNNNKPKTIDVFNGTAEEGKDVLKNIHTEDIGLLTKIGEFSGFVVSMKETGENNLQDFDYRNNWVVCFTPRDAIKAVDDAVKTSGNHEPNEHLNDVKEQINEERKYMESYR